MSNPSQAWIQSLLPMGIMTTGVVVGGVLIRTILNVTRPNEDLHRKFREAGRVHYRINFPSLSTKTPLFLTNKDVDNFQVELDDKINELSRPLEEVITEAMNEYELKYPGKINNDDLKEPTLFRGLNNNKL